MKSIRDVVQLVVCVVWDHEVASSNLVISTKNNNGLHSHLVYKIWGSMLLYVEKLSYSSILCGYSTSASARDFHSREEGSTPFTRSISKEVAPQRNVFRP